MKVSEYGSEHKKTVAMFQCAEEPGWVFIPSVEALAKTYVPGAFPGRSHAGYEGMIPQRLKRATDLVPDVCGSCFLNKDKLKILWNSK